VSIRYQKTWIIVNYLRGKLSQGACEKTSGKLDLCPKPTGPASTRIRQICGLIRNKPEEQRYLSWKETFWPETCPRNWRVLEKSGCWRCWTYRLSWPSCPEQERSQWHLTSSEISNSCVTMERLTQMMERRGEMSQRWADFRFLRKTVCSGIV
jgi:hypothetical protein